MTKFNHLKELLKKFENMEHGHVKMLTDLKNSDLKDIKLKEEIKDLQISDYLVESPPTKDMDYQDILIIAMKREEASTNLYKKLASEVEDEDAKKLFNRLAQEETEHKYSFEQLYDKDILTEN